jgi:hypothetical protein
MAVVIGALLYAGRTKDKVRATYGSTTGTVFLRGQVRSALDDRQDGVQAASDICVRFRRSVHH